MEVMKHIHAMHITVKLENIKTELLQPYKNEKHITYE